MKDFLYIITFLALCSLISCSSPQERRTKLAQSISKNICKNLSSELNFSVHSIGGEDNREVIDNIMGLAQVPVKNWNHCFIEVISTQLAEKFSEQELNEIKKDRMKQMMVIRKMYESPDVQASIEECVKGTLVKSGKDYRSFEKDLDEKFKK